MKTKKHITLRTKEKGRDAIFRDYEQLAVDHLYTVGKPQGSGAVFFSIFATLQKQGKSISRASTIFFLNRLEDQDLVEVTDATGKGGHHKLYHAHLPRKVFEEKIMKSILESALEALPLVKISLSFS